MPKRSRPINSVSINNLWMHRHLVLIWFTRVSLRLFLNIDLPSSLTVNDLREIYERISHFINDERDRLTKRNKDICQIITLPLTGNDPRDKFNVCTALKMLGDRIINSKIEHLKLPPALSFEFAEFTRSFMGPWRRKRDIVIVDSDVFSLAIIGAYVSHAYTKRERPGKEEHCYIFIDTPLPSLDKMFSLNQFGKTIARQILDQGDGSINSVIVGIASKLSIDRNIMEEVLKDRQSLLSVLRITRTGNKVLLKAYDLIEIRDLARTIRRLRLGFPLLNLIIRYPNKNEVKRDQRLARYRRYIESVAMNVLKYHWLGDPVYLYDILRPLYVDSIKESINIRLGDKADEVIDGLLKSVIT